MSVRATLWDIHENKYVSYKDLPIRLYRNRHVEYKSISIDDLIARKKSATVFVICSGPSVLSLTPEQWRLVSEHDSFGINFSYLLPHTPTYHIFSWERNVVPRTEMVKHFQSERARFATTVIMVNSKALLRFAHPRIVPEFFPEKPTCCFYRVPSSIQLERNRPFSDEDFDQTLFYRNTSSHVLELAISRLKYTNVVLLGVDLHTPKHFWYGMPKMKLVRERLMITGGDRHGILGSMIPQGNKYHPFDVYLYSLKDYLERKRNVKLFVQNKDNLLFPRLPAYFD